jgi:osmotically-inducible protein OsmY
MKNNFLVFALAIGTSLGLSSCTERQRDRVEHQADRAADKVESAADKAADQVERTADKAGDKMSEAATTTAVKSKLAADVRLSTLTSINVDTTGHVVTLKGHVPTAADRENAALVAKSVDGVVAVTNELIIKP